MKFFFSFFNFWVTLHFLYHSIPCIDSTYEIFTQVSENTPPATNTPIDLQNLFTPDSLQFDDSSFHIDVLQISHNARDCIEKFKIDNSMVINNCIGKDFKTIDMEVTRAYGNVLRQTNSNMQAMVQNYCSSNGYYDCRIYVDCVNYAFLSNSDPTVVLDNYFEKNNLIRDDNMDSMFPDLKSNFTSLMNLKQESEQIKSRLINKLTKKYGQFWLGDSATGTVDNTGVSNNNPVQLQDENGNLFGQVKQVNTVDSSDRKMMVKEQKDMDELKRANEWKAKISPETKMRLLDQMRPNDVKLNALNPLSLYPIPTETEIRKWETPTHKIYLSQKQTEEIKLKNTKSIF